MLSTHPQPATKPPHKAEKAAEAPMEPLAFRPIHRTDTRSWSPTKRFDFLDELQSVPLIDSEVLQTAHYLPILLDMSNDEPTLVAGVSRALLRQPLVAPDGTWTRGYMPVLLRCLPFGMDSFMEGGTERNRLLLSNRLITQDDPGEHPILSPEGGLADEAARVSQLLMRGMRGRQNLMAALEPLLLADVFAPIAALSRRGGELLSINAEALSQLTKLRASLIVSKGMFSAQILFAMLFSRRLLPSDLTLTIARAAGTAGKPAPASVEHTGLEFLDFSMDDSDMVPIDLASESAS